MRKTMRQKHRCAASLEAKAMGECASEAIAQLFQTLGMCRSMLEEFNRATAIAALLADQKKRLRECLAFVRSVLDEECLRSRLPATFRKMDAILEETRKPGI